MNIFEQQYYALLGLVSQLPKEDQTKINDYANKLRAILKESPEHTKLASTLVWLEEQMQPEEQQST